MIHFLEFQLSCYGPGIYVYYKVHLCLCIQDEFTVYEKSRWTGANRHIFLMDQRLIFTKEKDADGLYVYKDSLKGYTHICR